MNSRNTVLVLGARGRFGRSGAAAFAAAGWRVRCFDRKRDDLARAARGVEVILNGWNPPYTDWQRQLPGLTERVIGAARASGATVILPGNVYVFGADAPERFGPDTPHGAGNPLGRARVEMEARYRDSGIRTILLRAGDFLDTVASGNWFDRIMLRSLAKGVFTYPGDPDIPHAWAFLPDLLRAAVLLAERRGELPRFADIPFPGFTLSGRELAGAAGRAVGRELRLVPMSWAPMRLGAPFWPMGRRLLEMRYLWNKPHHLDGAAFARLLPGFAPTPLAEAVASAVSFQIDPDQTVAQPGLVGPR